MSNNKFKYPIFPDRLYTINIAGEESEVMGYDLIECYVAYSLYLNKNT